MDACPAPNTIPIEAVDVAHAVVWATVTTVDDRGRPRSRVLHPVWTPTATGCAGWVITRPTAVKVRHLARNPHVSCAYLSVAHDVACFDCTASWVDDPHTRRWAWTMVADTAPPVGYDPAAIIPGGVDSGDWALLHLAPFRIQVARGSALAAGARPPSLECRMTSIPTDDDRSMRRGRWPIVAGAVAFLAGSLLRSPEHASMLSLWTLISDSVFVFG